MGKSEKMIEIPLQDMNRSFCLDRVLMDAKRQTFQYAFVWRGNKKSSKGYISKPAYFTWSMLGRTIREAMLTAKIPPKEIEGFLLELSGLRRPDSSETYNSED